MILADVPLDESGYTTATVPLRAEKTLYTVIGDAFVYAVIAFLVIYPLSLYLTEKRRKHNEKKA